MLQACAGAAASARPGQDNEPLAAISGDLCSPSGRLHSKLRLWRAAAQSWGAKQLTASL